MLWLVKRWQTINAISLILWPLSMLYCLLAVGKRWLYRSLLPSYGHGVPVIVVGNITVGGTGKTPFVIWLAKWLQARGHQPGIVLRGYGGQSQEWPLDVTASTSALEAGDEAVLLARATQCPVVAAPDRVAAIGELLSLHSCSIVISDDGMQHYRMQRDLEIAIVDGVRRFGNGFCLPAGPLREPRWRANKADMVVVNGDAKDNENSMSLIPVHFRNISNTETVALNHFRGISVHAIAGIGNPNRFFTTLQELGLDVEPHPFPDHYRYQENDIRPIDDKPVIMTDKDAVKCESFADNRHWSLMVAAQPDSKTVEQLSSWLEKQRG
jgi:tetraacyldisaccharide 4'-kinase